MVPSSLFDECVATDAAEEIIEVDPLNGWVSLNFIGSASISAPIGMLLTIFPVHDTKIHT